MIRETYKGRKLKVVKGRGADYGYSRATLNNVDLGKHMGDEAAALRWMKGTIDHADQVGTGEGRYGAEWYAPGTFELNEHGHVVALGGICSCGYCEERRIQPCADIKVDGKCVCDHCMKPYLAEKSAAEGVAEGQDVDGAEEVQSMQIEPGVRVSGEVGGQSFTGIVRTVGRRGGRSAIAADGKFTRVEWGLLESVTVATNNELTMPSGRKVKSAHVKGSEALGSLRLL